MGKFETKGQIAGLFLAAAGVAFLLILLVNAEARKRGLLLEEIEIDQSVQIDNPIKRSVSDSNEGTLRKITEYVRSFYSEHFEKTRRKRSIENNQIKENDKISESILEEALNKKKIRHIDEKVQYLGKNNYLVESILRVYGNNDSSDTSVTIEDFHKFLNDNSNEERKEDESATENETKNAIGTIKEDAKSVDDNIPTDNIPTDNIPTDNLVDAKYTTTNLSDTHDTNANLTDAHDNDAHLADANDTNANLADAKDTNVNQADINDNYSHLADNNDDDSTKVHSPLLEENVFEDMHSTLKSATKSCSVNGSLFLVISMTTMVNMMLVLITLAFVRLYRHYKRLHNPQDKIWLCQEDDISRYYEEDIEPKLGPIVIT